MGTGYIRQDSANNIADGNVINASDLDGEFDGIVAAFGTSGHAHNGSAGEGGAITKFGPSLQYETDATALFPETNNAVDLGKTTKQFKDLYIDGVINADSMSADTATMISATITNNASVGGTFIVAGTATLSSTVDITGAASVASTLTVTNESKLQNVSATGTLNVDNNTTLGGNFSVSATATFSNNIFASADLIVASGLAVGAISSFSAKTTFTTDATVGGTLAVGGTTNLATATVSGTIDVSDNASVGGTHTVKGYYKNVSGNLIIEPATYIAEIRGGGSTDAELKLNCRSNSHGQTIKSQEHSAGVTNTMLLPKGANSTLVSEVGTATLTNKTLDAAVSVSAAGVVNVGTNLSVLGNAEVGGTFKITSTVSAEAALNVGGLLNVTGSAGLAGNVNLGNATANSVVVGGVLTANASANLTGNVGVGGTIIGASTISDSKGDIRDLDVSRTVTATAEIALTDLGQMVQLNSAGVQALIPSANVMTGAFSIGDIVSIINTTSTTGSITSQVNAFVGGQVSATGTITLGANGIANIYFISDDACIITGNVS